MNLETLTKANEINTKILKLAGVIQDMKEVIKKDRHWTIRVFCKEATVGYKLEDELKEQIMELLQNHLKKLEQELEEM